MPNKNSSFMPMAIIGLLFFVFGFVTWLNGSLIPFLKIICELNDFEALFVTFAFYIAYTVMALPMSFILERVGYKNAMALGLTIMVVGSLLFIPAAMSANYLIFLIALFVLGTGLTILQTASNPYIVLIGSKESAAMRISIMGLINKGAGVIVPLIFTALILSDIGTIDGSASAEQLNTLASRLIEPYVYMALTLSALVVLVKFSPLPELEFTQDKNLDQHTSIFKYPQAILGSIALFFYVGVEVIAADTIGLFGQSLAVENFTSLTSYTMVFMVIGYILGVLLIPKYISQEKALLSSAIAGILITIAIVLSSNTDTLILNTPNSIMLVALLGLANALVWPTIWPLALDGLGKQTARASALLIMAIAGGAILPLVFGKLAEVSGDFQQAYLVLIPSYLFILFYAIKGHKLKSW